MVEDLPPRVAHATHALIDALQSSDSGPYGPLTAAEVCVYDASHEAFSPRHTGAALREAQRFGLAAYVPPGYWIPTNMALSMKRDLERRFLRDMDEAERE